MDLQNKTIEMLIENEKLTEASNKKVLLYPSSEYSDRMDPVNIANEKGILFGWFNDEDIMCYSTGYNTIQDLEKAIKNKEYMIDSFQDDEDFDNMTGEECWNYVVKTIEDSYVDNDSYWSMFLIDANNGYKILYCGSEEPNIEEVKQRRRNMSIGYYVYTEGEPPYPYFKYGNYEFEVWLTNDSEIEISTEYFDSVFESSFTEGHYTLDQLQNKLNVDLLSLITPEQKLEYLKACKVYCDYKAEQRKQREIAYQNKKLEIQKQLSERCGQKIKTEVNELIFEYIKYVKDENPLNITNNLLYILNKCDYSQRREIYDNAYKFIYYFSTGNEYCSMFEKKYSILDKVITPGMEINRAWQIASYIVIDNYDSEEFLAFYKDDTISYEDLYYMDNSIKEGLTIQQYISIIKNPEYKKFKKIVVLGVKHDLNNEQLSNLIKLCKILENDYDWLMKNYKRNLVEDCIIRAIKNNISNKQIIDIYNRSRFASDAIEAYNELLSN